MGPSYYYQDADNNNNRLHNSWYADHAYFVKTSSSWFDRGGLFTGGAVAGQFYFDCNHGGTYDDTGFRLVLTK